MFAPPDSMISSLDGITNILTLLLHLQYIGINKQIQVHEKNRGFAVSIFVKLSDEL